MAGLVPATPIIGHSVFYWSGAAPCLFKRGRRVKPGDGVVLGRPASKSNHLIELRIAHPRACATEEAFVMTHYEAKQKLILAGRVLVAEGQDDFTRGHVSVRAPDDPGQFFMKPHSVG